MGTYSAACRSNTFLVKDREAFGRWAEPLDMEISDMGPLCVLFGRDDGWPNCNQDGEDFDFLAELSAHLAEGQVAILMESGGDWPRYVAGGAEAVDWRGGVCRVSIEEIYGRASQAFGVPLKQLTKAEY